MSHVARVDDDSFLGDAPRADDTGAAVDARLAELLSAAGGPLEWRSISAADAPGCWEELRRWVSWFRFEFAYDHRVVPPCWYRHPSLAQVLSALRDQWMVAYDPLSGRDGAAEWHRSLMLLEQRLRDLLPGPGARWGCTAQM